MPQSMSYSYTLGSKVRIIYVLGALGIYSPYTFLKCFSQLLQVAQAQAGFPGTWGRLGGRGGRSLIVVLCFFLVVFFFFGAVFSLRFLVVLISRVGQWMFYWCVLEFWS